MGRDIAVLLASGAAVTVASCGWILLEVRLASGLVHDKRGFSGPVVSNTPTGCLFLSCDEGWLGKSLKEALFRLPVDTGVRMCCMGVVSVTGGRRRASEGKIPLDRPSAGLLALGTYRTTTDASLASRMSWIRRKTRFV